MTTLLSLPHAAVEAGLGTLGLNLQLLTPEFGPRVLLTAVLCSVDVALRPQDGDRALPRPKLRALSQDLSGRCRRSLDARLAGLRPLPFAARLRAS